MRQAIEHLPFGFKRRYGRLEKKQEPDLMARKTTMWLMDDDEAICQALERAWFVENVHVVSTARPLETSFPHNPFLNAVVELAPEMDSDWDTFFKCR